MKRDTPTHAPEHHEAAAEVHKHPAGMGKLAACLYRGEGRDGGTLRKLSFGFRSLWSWATATPPQIPSWAPSLTTVTRALGSRGTRRAGRSSCARLSPNQYQGYTPALC